MNPGDLLGNLASQLQREMGGLVLCFLPMAALMVYISRRKKRFRADYLEPLTDLPLRPPGESLRLRIEELEDEMENSFFALMGASLGAFILLHSQPDKRSSLAGALLVLAIIYGIWGTKLVRQLRRLWDYRLGLKGECAVGQELNQLIADGFHVFHDLPFDGFNIDHVLVSSAGVWAVETKTRRKPASIKGAAKATVVYDGQTLHFPWGTDSFGLDQAQRNAATLSQWLTASTGDSTPVNAILVLPGWWVERKARGAVNVLNSKEVRHSFPTRTSDALSRDLVQRIVFQLTERCRIPRTK